MLLAGLGTCIAISLFTSVALVAVISGPLRAFVASACPGKASQDFWTRFTIVMLFLSPLFVSVTFGLPPARQVEKMQLGELIQGIVTTALIGAFLSMLGTGLWVSSMAKRMPGEFR